MPNPSKRRGTDWEMRCSPCCATTALTRPQPAARNLDVGDLRFTDRVRRHGRGGVQATKAIDLAGGMNELAVETARADAAVRGAGGEAPVAPTGRAYAVMELADFAALVAPEEA